MGCATHEQGLMAMPHPPAPRPHSGASTKGEWAKHRETIRQLYLGEKKSLNNVMEIMRTQHGFTAT